MAVESVPKPMPTKLQGSSLKARFIRSTAWSMLATAVAQGLMLFASMVAARILSKVSFGELWMVQSTVGMFGVFAGAGLGITATKQVAALKDAAPERAGRTIGLCIAVSVMTGGVFSALLLILSGYLAPHALNAAHLVPAIRVGAVLLLLNAVNVTQISALAGLEAFKSVAKANFVQGILGVPCVLIGVQQWGVSGAVGGMVIAAAAGCAASQLLLRSEAARQLVPISYRNAFTERRILVGFSLPAFLAGAMTGPVIWAANAMLAATTDGYAQIGIFSAAGRFLSVLCIAGATINSALVPILASADGCRSERLNRGSVLITWLMGVVPALALMSFPEVVRLAFGDQFAGEDACRTTILIMCSAAIMLYKDGLARALVVNDLMWWGVISNCVWAVALLGSLVFLRSFGAVGMATAYLMAYVINTAVFVPLYYRRQLVPPGTIISAPAFATWIVIAVSAAAGLAGTPLAARALWFVVSTVILYVCFRSLSRRRSAE